MCVDGMGMGFLSPPKTTNNNNNLKKTQTELEIEVRTHTDLLHKIANHPPPPPPPPPPMLAQELQKSHLVDLWIVEGIQNVAINVLCVGQSECGHLRAQMRCSFSLYTMLSLYTCADS